jgi:hypothetical protein
MSLVYKIVLFLCVGLQAGDSEKKAQPKWEEEKQQHATAPAADCPEPSKDLYWISINRFNF